MPKLKTHSGAKKRFKLTASGKVKAQAAFKRHCLEQKSQKMKRNARGTMVLSEPDARILKQYFLVNS